ncbi:nestin [Syngnathoides biaculeatus]|uniref:nestin n=1 Tax=Syngnathoides biaculeatus TaxID=300417 RepID=UPI002ADE5165|nr:nestin [Syngnathoides biaculeatus]
MDLHIPAHSRHVAQEKRQMLDLNCRLQSYLSRVKLLEEENTLLAQEIQTLRHGHRGASVREKSLKEDLQWARAQLEDVWRARVYAQMEVCRLSDELQMVEHHRLKEAREQAEVRAKIEVSRKELGEEHGAHRWLKEKVKQLEQELEHLVRSHEEDVAHLEATLSHSAQPCFTPTPDLSHLEEEFCQWASTACQERAETYQAQLDQLEECLKETGDRLCEMERHKNKYQSQLRALERERISEGDVKKHLEETALHQREEHRQQINTLQDHWEGLEKEKQHLGQELDLLVKENQALLKQKMSLGLEVVTYRALLDGESLRRDDVTLLKQSGNISHKDPLVKLLRGNYQVPVHPKTLTSVWRPPSTSITPLRSKPITARQVQKDEDRTMRGVKQESPYPKILHDGAVEVFRAQEVDEKVTHAEPLSSPGREEHEVYPAECRNGGKEEEHGRSSEEKAAAGFQVQFGALPLTQDITQNQSGTQEPENEIMGTTEETFSFSTGVPVQAPINEDIQEEKAAGSFQLQSGAPLLTQDITQNQSGTQELKTEIVGMTEDTFSSSTSLPVETSMEEDLQSEKVAARFQLQSEALPLTQDITQNQSGTEEPENEIMGTTEETFSFSTSVPVQAPMKKDIQEEKADPSFQLQLGAPLLTQDITQNQSGTQEPENEILGTTEETISFSTGVPVQAPMKEDIQEEKADPSFQLQSGAPLLTQDITQNQSGSQEQKTEILGTTEEPFSSSTSVSGETLMEEDFQDEKVAASFQLQSGAMPLTQDITQNQSGTQEPENEIMGTTEETFNFSTSVPVQAPINEDIQKEKADPSFQLQLGAPLLTQDITQNQSGTQEPENEILGTTEETISFSTGVPVQAPMEEDMQEEKAATSFQLQSGALPLTQDITQNQSGTQEQKTEILGTTEDTFSFSTSVPVQAPMEEDMPEEKAAASFQLQSGALPLTRDITQNQSGTQEPKTEILEMTEETCSSSTSVPVALSMEEDVQEEMSSPGTEAFLQVMPEPGHQTQCDFNPVDTTEISQEISHSPSRMTLMEGVDVLYPDGEEMDTWDSVIEKKVHVESSEPKPETERQYAEPEEDILTRRSEPSQDEMKKQEDEIWPQHEESSPHPDDNDEDEDSQNTSLSWRTELESDSYAQENTLADTRPLIRYTSDEMDANTQVSRVHEGESSDGEQDWKIGEMGGTAWSESKNKNFGTMEDLCEKVEEEEVEYDLKRSNTDLEASELQKATSEVSDDNLDEEEPADLDDVELDTDRLVEQELENLSTDRYASHFAKALANESYEVLPEDQEEDYGITTTEHEAALPSKVQVTHNLVLKDTSEPQKWQEVQEEDVQDREMKTKEVIMESDVQVEHDQDRMSSSQPRLDSPHKDVEETPEEADLNFKDTIQLQLDSQAHDPKEKVEEKEIQAGMLTMEQEVITESVFQAECDLDLGDLASPQLDTFDDEEKIKDEIIIMDQEEAHLCKGKSASGRDADLHGEDNLDLGDSIVSQMAIPDDDELEKMQENEAQHRVMKMEELSTKSDIQVGRDQEFMESFQAQSDTQACDTKEKVEEEEVKNAIMTVKQDLITESGIQEESDLTHRVSALPRFDTADDDDENVLHEIMTLEEEEAYKGKLPFCVDPDLPGEDNLDLGDTLVPQLDTPEDEEKEEMEEQDVQDGKIITKQEEADEVILPSHMDPNFQGEENLEFGDFVKDQLDSPAEDLEGVTEETEKVYMLSSRESDVRPKLDSLDHDSGEEMEEKEVEGVMLPREQEEPDKMKTPCTDPEVQGDDNLDLSDFIPPQLESSDDFEFEGEMMKQREGDKAYLLSCREFGVDVEHNLHLVQPQLDSPDEEEKVQDKIMTKEEEVPNNVNLPFCMEHNVQAEDNLDLGDCVQPKLDSPDDSVKDTQDGLFNREHAIKVTLPVSISPDLQIEDNLGLRDIVQPEKKDAEDEEVQEPSEAPEKTEDKFELNVSMVTHADETFSEFLSGPDVEEEDKDEEHLEKLHPESQNQESLLQQYAFVAADTADEWNLLGKTSQDIEIRHPKDQGDGVASHVHEEGGDGESCATFDEDPVEISVEETVIIASSSEFHKTKGKDKRDIWAAAVAAPYESDDITTVTSAIHDVEFGSDLEWGKAVDRSSPRKSATGVSVHSEESEGEGEAWSSGDE